MATEMLPGPTVNGMVSGKNAVEDAVEDKSGAGARRAWSCFLASLASGACSSPQARTATTRPPAMRSAPIVMPKNASRVLPIHKDTSRIRRP